MRDYLGEVRRGLWEIISDGWSEVWRPSHSGRCHSLGRVLDHMEVEWEIWALKFISLSAFGVNVTKTSGFTTLLPRLPHHKGLHLELWAEINPSCLHLFFSGHFISQQWSLKKLRQGGIPVLLVRRYSVVKMVFLPDLPYSLNEISVKTPRKFFCGSC